MGLVGERIILSRERFPHAQVGDDLHLLVIAKVRRVEAEEIDAVGYGTGPLVLHGQAEIELTVTEVRTP